MSRGPLGLVEIGWSCSGFPNWTITILLLVLIKMFLEDLNKEQPRSEDVKHGFFKDRVDVNCCDFSNKFDFRFVL